MTDAEFNSKFRLKGRNLSEVSPHRTIAGLDSHTQAPRPFQVKNTQAIAYKNVPILRPWFE